LFGGQPGIDLVCAHPIPRLADEHPKIRAGKPIHRNPKAPMTKQQNNYASALNLNARIDRVTMVPHPGFGCIILLQSELQPQIENYMMTISSFLECNCPNFKEINSLGKRESWANCKHLYYIFTVTCNLESMSDVFMHAASFSFNKVKLVLLVAS